MALSTDVELCNMSLAHFAGGEITNLESENSRPAEVCRKFFSTALDYVLGDHDWKFASTKKAGVPITVPSAVPEITEDDLDGWQFLYAYPADCVKVREILTANQYQNTDPFGYGNPAGAAYGPEDVSAGYHIMPSNSYTLSNERGFGDQRGPEIPFNVAAIGNTKYIFSDVDNARFRFTRRMSNVIGYPADFSLCFSYYFASLMAYNITRKFEVSGNMLKMYENFKPSAHANNMNETTNITRDPPPSWVRARGGD